VRAALLAGLVAAAIASVGLADAPFIDPPEGFHAEIAREMLADGAFVTPRLNDVRYFDKPPVPYWLMAASFSVAGPSPGAARVWSAIALVGIAAATAAIGVLLRGPRLGFLAGLFATANLGLFLYARLVKPDLLFVFFLTLGWLGVVIAGRGFGARVPGLALCYASLGIAAITKDVLGAVGPLAVLAIALAWSGERPLSRWFPWWGGAVLLIVATPWYLAVEAQNGGFLWYTIVDNHLLNLVRQRAFPDEDVPLRGIEFLFVTAVAFVPWVAAAPIGFARALREPPATLEAKLWRIFGLWAFVVIGFFAVTPFKLPHYAFPAFPALALLAARVWDEALGDLRTPRLTLVPVLVLFVLLAAGFAAMSFGVVSLGPGELTSVDVATRNLSARGQDAPAASLQAWRPVLVGSTVIFVVAVVVLAVSVRRRAVALGAAAAVGAMIAFLPLAGQGMADFARARSAAPVVEALMNRVGTSEVIHEGALEHSGSILLALRRPVHVVNGLASNLAYGATFSDSRHLFWDEARFAREWNAAGRRFLVSVVPPEQSVVSRLPAGGAHLLARSGTHWLYSNLAD